MGWSPHPSNWNQPDIRGDSDQMVVLWHSSVFHDIINKPSIYETSTVTFIEQPSFHPVDTCEVNCFDNLNAYVFKA